MAEAVGSQPRQCCTAIVQVWAIFTWVIMFAKCIVDLTPGGFEPFQKQNLTSGQWAGYAAIALSIWLCEGIGAFQRSFSPMVVRRGYELNASSRCYEIVLAPFFSAGLFAATPTRLLKSWLLMAILIPGLALTVPHLPYPWRGAVDAGVVLGLGWGTAVIAILGLRGLVTGQWPDRSAELPSNRECDASNPLSSA
eukprot:TRINITY_DN87863_c0_g1_i1.p1 TRINITY_DN87863_c0_g1~~TRINITY_DN87863_c0_g1_i1.p1  ORF type:complete len:214 (-),score=20.73 TRINITY_DN87863_c0_g1_i1:36-620(-)